MPSLPALFAPLTVRQTTVRNRLWVSPMCLYSVVSGDGLVAPWHQMHYGSLAAGCAGLVMVEATAVSPEGRMTLGDLGLWDDAQIPGLQSIAGFIHAQGAVAGIQLGHAGRKASTTPMWAGSVPLTKAQGAYATLAPSAVAYGNYPVPSEMSTAQIEAVATAFGAAANRANQAGFDVVEIHAAHGYLLHQFASPLSNRRSDSYGGSLENRTRLHRQVLQTVRQNLPASTVVAMRLSATDWVEGGWDLDQSIQLVKAVKAAGLDHVDVSAGGLVDYAKAPAAPGYLAPFAGQIRQATGLSVNTVGIISTAVQANQLVATGVADAVMLGRPLLRNPHLPIAWAAELGVDPLALCPPQYSQARWRD